MPPQEIADLFLREKLIEFNFEAPFQIEEGIKRPYSFRQEKLLHDTRFNTIPVTALEEQLTPGVILQAILRNTTEIQDVFKSEYYFESFKKYVADPYGWYKWCLEEDDKEN